MIFVFDIGNTNTVLGVFEEDTLTYEWRIKTDRHMTEDEFAVKIKALFEFKNITFSHIKGVIISSVVPPIMPALELFCQNYFGINPLIVGKDTVKHQLDMQYPRPSEIGADRIVNAVGAISLYDTPLIIIDFGTATTFCYVDEEQAYYGGIIAPGVNISMDALYNHASKLPKIEIEKPETIVGKSTIGAMQSGVYYGYVAQVDGMITRIKEEVGGSPTVIATGGLAALIAEESQAIEHIEEHLTLKGLYAIYQKNKQ